MSTKEMKDIDTKVEEVHPDENVLRENKDEGDGKASTCEKKSDERTGLTLKRMLAQAYPERGILILGTVALFFSSMLNLAVPAFIGTIIDAISSANANEDSANRSELYDTIAGFGFGDTPRNVLNAAVVILALIICVAAVFSFLRGYLFTLAGERVVARLRRRLFEKFMCMDIAFFDETRTGELINRLSSDTAILKAACTVNISMGLRFVGTILGGVLYLFVISWKLTLVMLSVVPLVAVGVLLYGKKVKGLSIEIQSALARATEVAEESISHIRTVRSFSKEHHQSSLYSAKIQRTYELGAEVSFLFGCFNAGLSLVGTGAMVLVLWYGATLVLDGEMSPGVLTSFVLYTLYVGFALMSLSGVWSSFMQAVGANDRVFSLIDQQPSINIRGGKRGRGGYHSANAKSDTYTLSGAVAEKGGNATLDRSSVDDAREVRDVDGYNGMHGCVELDSVSFSYPSRPEVQVLNNVSLTLRPGSVTALVGPSGGGKSTVVALIERFYDVSAGRLSIDGVDLKELDPEWCHQRIGLISQDPVLFATTIRENLLYGLANRGTYSSGPVVRSGSPEGSDTAVSMKEVSIDIDTDAAEAKEHASAGISQAALDAACKMANCYDFIHSFPEGYDTMVGERGVRLSGGQKQRVAIARAILMNPSILIADEATSSLDAESEHHVQEALDRVMRGRTVLVVAHRLSTVKNADNVVVIEAGEVAEQGTHDELLALGPTGMYSRLVRRQLTGKGADTSTVCNNDDDKTCGDDL